MKIAVVHPIPLVPGTIDLAAYVRQFEAMGYESLLVTSKYLRGPTDIRIVERSIEQMADPSMWRELGIDIAVTFLWFQYPEIPEALSVSGARVVSRADSDGMQNIRVFPRSFFRCMVEAAPTGRKFIEFRSFVHRYLIRHQAEDQSLLRTIAASQSVVIETHEAAKNLRRVLIHLGRGYLARKIAVAPHCVDDLFLSGDVPIERPRSVVAIGRWTAPQKNPQLLRAVIRLHLARAGDTRFTVIGPGADTLCGDLARQTGRIDCHEQVPPDEIRRHLLTARVLLFASRWEGAPISANEALACGCSVVGTPIPAFVEIARAGPFGAASSSHRASSLHEALQGELDAWETGRRSPTEIAQFWRPRLSQRRVMQQSLAAAQLGEEPAAAIVSQEPMLQAQVN
jgi:glycosyltransferase involved in cell wall biosynthesis